MTPRRRACGRITGVLALCLGLALLWIYAFDAAEAGPGNKPVLSMWEMRQAQVVRQQWDLSCGAATLSTLLTFQHNDPASEAEIIRTILRRSDPVRIRARQGFSLLDLKRFVEARGYIGDGYAQLTLEDLIDLAPAIVPTTLGGYNHFVVFRGVRGDRVLLADPAYGNRTMRIARFMAAWPEKIAFVVQRRDGTAPISALNPGSDLFSVPSGIAVRARALEPAPSSRASLR